MSFRRCNEWGVMEVAEAVVVANDLALVLLGAPSDLVVSEVDFTTCKCKLHVVVDHDIAGASGCAGEPLGFHSAIQALYKEPGGPLTFCHAEPKTRERDQELARMMMSTHGKYAAYARDVLMREVRVYAGRTNFQFEAFGAFFCFQGGIRHEFRMRVARILGPKPLVVDVLRAMRVCGRKWMPYGNVVRVGDDMYHLEQASQMRYGNGGLKLMRQLLAVVKKHGTQIRIGAKVNAGVEGKGLPKELSGAGNMVDYMANYLETERFKALLTLMESLCGHKVPKSGHLDLAVASFSAAAMPGTFFMGRERLKRLVCVGEAALLLDAISAKFRGNSEMCGLQQYRTAVMTNGVMSSLMAGSVIADHVALTSGETLYSVVGASALEAFAGVLSLYCSTDAVGKMAKAMGMPR